MGIFFDITKILELLGPIMLATFLIVLLLFIIITMILRYHWKKYGVSEEKMRRVYRIYMRISLAFFAVMITSMIAYYIV